MAQGQGQAPWAGREFLEGSDAGSRPQSITERLAGERRTSPRVP